MHSELWFVIPLVAVSMGGLAVFVWVAQRKIRRRELAEVKRFEALPRTADEAFLNDLGIDAQSPFAKQALAIREAIAELATISAESLGTSVRISSDLDRLPFFDSPDVLGVVLEIEKKTGMSIDGDFQEDLCRAISEGTIRDVVKVIVDRSKKHNVPNGA